MDSNFQTIIKYFDNLSNADTGIPHVIKKNIWKRLKTPNVLKTKRLKTILDAFYEDLKIIDETFRSCAQASHLDSEYKNVFRDICKEVTELIKSYEYHFPRGMRDIIIKDK